MSEGIMSQRAPDMTDTVVTTSVGADHGHPVDLMLDGDPDTFYRSAAHPKRDDWVMLDFGAPRAIGAVTLLLGSGTGQWTLHSGVLEYSDDSTGWTELATVPSGVATFHHYADTPVTARYLRLLCLADQGYRVAIRSFEVRAPGLLPPSVAPAPFPLRVSTFAVPAYGKLVFSFTGPAGSNASTAVRCKSILIKVPTGRRPEALTSAPARIRSGAAPVAGEEQGYHWNVTRLSTDPEVTVFRCRPEVTARFHAGWTLTISLASIEMNGAAGTAWIDIEEETALPDSPDAFTTRVSRYAAAKSADEFYFENLRPRSAVVGWNQPIDLLWHGSGNAQYRMYFRDVDGKETSVEVDNGFWTTPRCTQNANFTLEATTSGGQKRYLTTSVKVEGGAIDAASLRVTGTLTTPRITAEDGQVIEFAGTSLHTVHGNLTVESDGELVCAHPVNVGGDVEIEGKVTGADRIEASSDFFTGRRLSVREVAVALLDLQSSPSYGWSGGSQSVIYVLVASSTADGPSMSRMELDHGNAKIVAEAKADSGDTAAAVLVASPGCYVVARAHQPDSAQGTKHEFKPRGRSW
ncbi:discoidin domain-containing protein [Nocardia sp. NBC_00881]|uniref:discoidin domain-containing protein n=1 Tax=Nocardia sp. NBC_00881 TaxID=2975995 RepID=UPI003869C4AA|nr:discoidin domain-containing protein [Nocardia sp. NBC_00881]